VRERGKLAAIAYILTKPAPTNLEKVLLEITSTNSNCCWISAFVKL